MKKYFIIKTTVKVFEAWTDRGEDDAINMVKNKEYVPVGSEKQRGYITYIFSSPLEEWKAVEAVAVEETNGGKNHGDFN